MYTVQEWLNGHFVCDSIIFFTSEFDSGKSYVVAQLSCTVGENRFAFNLTIHV